MVLLSTEVSLCPCVGPKGKEKRRLPISSAERSPKRSGSNGHDAGKEGHSKFKIPHSARGVAVDPAKPGGVERPHEGHVRD
jgi:hypothetical protein